MAVLDSLIRRRRIRKLRRRLRDQPTPEGYADLIRLLVRSSREREAAEEVRKAIERFGACGPLARLERLVRRQVSSGQLRTIQEGLNQRPKPTLYRDLAVIQIEMGDLDEAMLTAEECEQAFPLSGQPCFIRGRVRLERFLVDRTARDGMDAVRQLRQALQKNPDDKEAAQLLGTLLYSVGAYSEALKWLARYRPAPVHWTRWEEMARWCRLRSSDSLKLEEAFRRVEETGRLLHRPYSFDTEAYEHGELLRQRADPARVASRLQALEGRGGVLKMAVLPVDNKGCTGAARSGFAGLVASLGDLLWETSREADLGNLSWAIFTGPFGRVAMTRLRGVLVGLLCDRSARVEGLLDSVETVVVRSVIGR